MSEKEWCPQHGYPAPCPKCCFGCKRVELPTPGSKEYQELVKEVMSFYRFDDFQYSNRKATEIVDKVLALLGGKE